MCIRDSVYGAALPVAFGERIAIAEDLFSAALPALGLSTSFYAAYFTGLEALFLVASLLVGMFVFATRSDDWVALAYSLMLICFSATFALSTELLAAVSPLWRWPVFIVDMTGKLLIALVLLIFPDGRFVPRWSSWLMIPYTLVSLMLAWSEPLEGFLPRSAEGIGSLLLLSVVASQVYRYQKVSSPEQRQQTKWIVYGVGVVGISLSLFVLIDIFATPFIVDRPTVRLIYRFVMNAAFVFGPVLAIPLSVGLAVTRSRLWEVDYVINRSLAYALVSVSLLLVFVATLFGVQALLRQVLSGEAVVVAVAIAAGICGALFGPIRQTAQQVIDRRLYGIDIDYKEAARQEAASALRREQADEVVQPVSGLDSYGDLRLLDHGGMSEVFLGNHPELRQPVAIKMLPSKLASKSEDYLKRLSREAQAIARLDHRNVIRVHDYQEATDGTAWMVTEYLGGGTLSGQLKEFGRLPLSDVQGYIEQVSEALDYIHQQGLVHRDVKPSNIMLDPITSVTGEVSYRVVLMDFGVAKVLDSAMEMTQTGVIGTLAYIAPEQIQDSAKVDGRADVYALGVTTYELLTGHRPFAARNPAALLISHLNQPAPDVRKDSPDLPPHVALAIQRAMAKTPDQRYDHASDFAAALRGPTPPASLPLAG
ncbi:MAG: serine/threonine protein kinase, partial [Chloroflexi bacterium]|nr:serine/threonine protein kinase [Chloroflexota bacterium]